MRFGAVFGQVWRALHADCAVWRGWIFASVLLFVFALTTPVHAHELQPAFLEIRPGADGASTLQITWKLPTAGGLADGVRLRLPAAWRVSGEVIRQPTADAMIEHFAVDAAGGMAGQRLALDGPMAKLVDVLIRIVRPDGSVQFSRLTPADADCEITLAASGLRQAATFLSLGIDHILRGVDHLLFVLGLLLIVREWRMLVKTITAFTVAHSLTLGVATLGYANAPLLPLNAAIALSILFLAPEMVRVAHDETSFTIRHPWVVAFAFGLLHGFGFASGLTALGLARGEIPLALLCFNVGVELGQLGFVLLVFALAWSFRKLEIRWARWAPYLPAYTVGTLGVYWTIQRTMMLFASSR